MHLIRFLISYVIVTILGLIMLLFLALNHHMVELDLIDGQHTVSLAWIMVGAAAVGFVIPLLLLVPGRIAAAVNAWRLERDLQEVEEQFVRLQEVRVRLLAKHESLVDRYERLLLHYQHAEIDLRETEAELEEVRMQLAASKAYNAARPIAATASAAATRVQGTSPALRVLPQIAPPPAASLPAAPTPPARPMEQSPALHPTASAAGATVRDVRTVQPEQQQPVQWHAAPSASQSAATPASAPVVVEPSAKHEQTVVVPLSPASPILASLAPPIPEAPSEVTRPLDRSHIPHARQAPIAAKMPHNATSATRRPAERLVAGVHHGLWRVGKLAARLRKRITALCTRVAAQIAAQLARLTRRTASGDAISRNEQSLTEISTSQHAD
jgi:hypothetical protein